MKLLLIYPAGVVAVGILSLFKVEATSLFRRRGYSKVNQHDIDNVGEKKKEKQLACKIPFSSKDTKLIVDMKGVDDSSYYYKSDQYKGPSSTHTLLKQSMGRNEITQLLEKRTDKDQCSHLLAHFHLYGFEGAAMGDAKASQEATGCLLNTGKGQSKNNVSCIAYYAKYQGQPIGSAEKIFGDNVDDEQETYKTSTVPKELDEVYRPLYKPHDCEALKEVTALLCQELGVEDAYDTKVYDRDRGYKK